MADEDTLEFRLELSLKKISLLSVAESLWKSPDVTNKIDSFIIDEVVTLPCDKYDKKWEEVLDCVLGNIFSLPIAELIRKFLKEMIILIEDNIHIYYELLSRCKWCKTFIGTKEPHSYYFFSLGILQLRESCSLLHWMYVPKNEEAVEFFHKACTNCDEKTVNKYQNDIIAHLESIEPGLNLKSKKDVVFNIVCVWNYIFENGVRNPNRLSATFLSNTDYIIPLKDVLDVIFREQSKIKFLQFRPNLLLDLLKPHNLEAMIFPNFSRKTRLDCDLIYIGLHFLPQHVFSHFMKKHANDVIKLFSRLWPYVELVLKMADYLIEEQNWSSLRLYYLTYAISLENWKRYSAKKHFYLELFPRIWAKTSMESKRSFLKWLIRDSFKKSSVLIINLNENDLERPDLELQQIIFDKCDELFEN